MIGQVFFYHFFYFVFLVKALLSVFPLDSELSIEYLQFLLNGNLE